MNSKNADRDAEASPSCGNRLQVKSHFPIKRRSDLARREVRIQSTAMTDFSARARI